MPEYDPPRSESDVDLELEPYEPPPWQERRRARRWPWVVLVVLLLAAAAFYFFYWRPRSAAPSAPQASEAPTEPLTVPAPRIEEEPAGPVPPLDGSDGWLREQARTLTDDPLMERALRGEDLARRLVVSVINAAEGVSPRRQFPALAPEQPFAPDVEDGSSFLGPTSYRRYDALARLVDSLSVDAGVRAYRLARPLLTAAFREQGYPNRTLEGMLRRALAEVESTPAPSGPIALERGVRSWRYVDPQLEALSPLQKQLLRMGPRNREIIQTKLQQFVARLDEE